MSHGLQVAFFHFTAFLPDCLPITGRSNRLLYWLLCRVPSDPPNHLLWGLSLPRFSHHCKANPYDKFHIPYHSSISFLLPWSVPNAYVIRHSSPLISLCPKPVHHFKIHFKYHFLINPFLSDKAASSIKTSKYFTTYLLKVTL